ncbi:MAG: hypothetical protein ACE3JN_09370 [Ectobacillus sp.]
MWAIQISPHSTGIFGGTCSTQRLGPARGKGPPVVKNQQTSLTELKKGADRKTR